MFSPQPTGQPCVIEEGKDYLVEDDVILPYRLLRNLGHGHSADVEMVEDISTGSVFRLYGSRTERKRVFENEIKIIRRLAPHHHVIRVFATYVSKREVGLILSPVAQGDLEILLQDVYDADAPTPDQRHTLDISFGCLATGLAFMHRQKVRHKDIKPRNILVHNGSMIFTDFGYSLDHALNDNSTTTGRPDTFTRRYCAPEVDDWGPRNSKSDVFSLGCVFSQVLEALRFQQPKVSPSTCFHEIIEEIQSDLIELNTQDLYWNVAGTTASMLSRKPRDRFSADYVVAWLRKNSGGLFCQTCKNSSESYYFDGPSSAPEDLATLEEDILAIWDFHDLRRYLIKRANAPLYACTWIDAEYLIKRSIFVKWHVTTDDLDAKSFMDSVRHTLHGVAKVMNEELLLASAEGIRSGEAKSRDVDTGREYMLCIEALKALDEWQYRHPNYRPYTSALGEASLEHESRSYKHVIIGLVLAKARFSCPSLRCKRLIFTSIVELRRHCDVEHNGSANRINGIEYTITKRAMKEAIGYFWATNCYSCSVYTCGSTKFARRDQLERHHERQHTVFTPSGS